MMLIIIYYNNLDLIIRPGPNGGEEDPGMEGSSGPNDKTKTPEQIRPFPKSPPRKLTNNRRHAKSRILTKTPIKTDLDAELAERAQKKYKKINPS